jgi:hypothetical protein
MGIVNVHKYADTIKNWLVYIGLNRILIHLIRVHLSSVWGQLKPHLWEIVRGTTDFKLIFRVYNFLICSLLMLTL